MNYKLRLVPTQLGATGGNAIVTAAGVNTPTIEAGEVTTALMVTVIKLIPGCNATNTQLTGVQGYLLKIQNGTDTSSIEAAIAAA